MTREERFERISSELARKGSVDGDELAAFLGASRATVRRDLDEMQRRGLLRRTHGGAAMVEGRDELPFQSKLSVFLPEKRAIAAAAASLIEDGCVVGCTGGTTVTLVIKALKGRRVTVVTNAINLAMELAASEGTEVVVTGGVLRTRSYELVGHVAERTIQDFHLDVALLGVDGLDFDHGISTFTIAEAHAAALYVEHSREVWVVTDHSKIGKTAPAIIAPLSRVSRVITDAGVKPDYLERFAQAGIRATVASP
ncbi:MAG TPA: DeoR/GlpR family DNA-binding transcription regulator [Spirochaetia bacterium]|nr:DeoR/GlpR family DNA-binding transcription regulator [Spirochaetia bacterium]